MLRAILLVASGSLVVQASAPPPTKAADVGSWDAAIVRRAAALIPTVAQWDHAASGQCAHDAARVSLPCALQQAADEAGVGQPAISDCHFQGTSARWEGTCGPLFDEMALFSVARVAEVKTGIWRTDATPREVFAGTMSDAAAPVHYEARQVVATFTKMPFENSFLFEFNNDPDTTFDTIQKFFAALKDRVRANAAADLARSSDDVEIEIYNGGSGVIRTFNGWFPVTGFSVSADAVRFTFDGKHEVAPNAVDRKILERASTVIASEAVWNRADNRTCSADAKTWSIYCAVQKAMIEVTGGFNHRRPAGQLVREIIDTRTKDRDYRHRIMDNNNDPRTQLADVRSLFAEALARVQ
jgi:hypothetical protein